jgi:hypothetical protein
VLVGTLAATGAPVSCVIKLGVLLGDRKYERCFDVSVLLLLAPRWLIRRTPALTKGGTR